MPNGADLVVEPLDGGFLPAHDAFEGDSHFGHHGSQRDALGVTSGRWEHAGVIAGVGIRVAAYWRSRPWRATSATAAVHVAIHD